MDSFDNLDNEFRIAVGAIDVGDEELLQRLLEAEPRLARNRLESPGAWLREIVGKAVEPGGFFERPYLLWFVAEDPVRNSTLPPNISNMARLIILASRQGGGDNLKEQLDYALRLVGLSWIARNCGVQIELIDVLCDAGASLDGHSDFALVNGNFAAAEHLVRRGAKPTLATALCLGWWEEVPHLFMGSTDREKRFALILAALHGKTAALRELVARGLDVNSRSEDLFPHGTALHHAVCSGNLEAVKLLVEAGADCNTKDGAWDGTPLDWADHYVNNSQGKDAVKQFVTIATYLREKRLMN